MKIPPGHQLKITKNLEKMGAKFEAENAGLDSTADERKLSAQSEVDERPSNSYIKSHTDLEIIEDPTRMGEIFEKSEGIAVGTDDGPGSLLNGQYNEQESHQSFLEALHAWRKGKNPSDTTQPNGIIKTPSNDKPESRESRTKTVRFNEVNDDNQKTVRKVIMKRQTDLALENTEASSS